MNNNENYIDNADQQYVNLLNDIIENGNDRGDRTGTGTRSTFAQVIRHNMSTGFPLITTKKMATKQMVNELWWLISGMTNIKPMVDANNYIWVGDAYKKYDRLYGNLSIKEFIERIKTDDEFAKIHGELGPVYGKQWRNIEEHVESHLEAYQNYLSTRCGSIFFPQNSQVEMSSNLLDRPTAYLDLPTAYSFENFYAIITGIDEDVEMVIEDAKFSFKEVYGNTRRIDQLQEAVDKIINNHEDRRIIVNSWNVAEISKMTLPPCHYSFQFYVEKLTEAEMINELKKANLLSKYEDTLSCISFEKFCNRHNVPTKKVSLAWNQRSVDSALGLPFNISSYALLLEIVCKMTNTIPHMLVGFLGDTHIYSDHLELAKVQANNTFYPLCKVKLPEEFGTSTNIDDITGLENFDIWNKIEFENYQSSGQIKYQLSN